jgi:hypothetical protein
MGYGFVYLLGNKAMPCLYKIGCTERSPHARAAQLSAATGVPTPFDVLLYIEVANFQRVEQKFHEEMADFRASDKREFFCFGPAHMDWLWWAFQGYEGAVAFADPAWQRYGFHTPDNFPEDYVETWVDGDTYLCQPDAPPLDGPELDAAMGRA